MKKFIVYFIFMAGILNATTLIEYNEKFSLLKTEKEAFDIEKNQFEEDLIKREENIKRQIEKNKDIISQIKEIKKAIKEVKTDKEIEEKKLQDKKEAEMIKIYEKMKPDSISDVFSILIKEEKELAKRLFEKFPMKVARIVLSKMEPKLAAEITIEVLIKKEK